MKRALSVVLTLVSLLLLAAVAATAFYMLVPIDLTGAGRLGMVGLAFPLHFLAVTLGAAALGMIARRLGARLASGALRLVVASTLLMALVPCLAQWKGARQHGVSLSLADYLTAAVRLNRGLALSARTIEYGAAPDGTKLVLDVWRSDRVPPGALRPAFVRVHGGAWIHGRRSELGAWNRWLNGLGYDVFDVEYRLPPPERWRDEVGDVKCALGWLAANAARYQVDPERISVTGHSAGGNLAMLAAYSTGDPQLPPSCAVPEVRVKSVVNFYGPADLDLLYRSSGSPAYAQDALRRYIGGTLAQHPERYRAVSPLSHVGANLPPTLTILGTSDRIVPADQAEALHRAIARAGGTHELYLLPATDHGFDANWGGFGTQITRAKIERFLEQHGGR